VTRLLATTLPLPPGGYGVPLRTGAPHDASRPEFRPTIHASRLCRLALPYAPLRVWGGPLLAVAMAQRAGGQPGDGGVVVHLYQWPCLPSEAVGAGWAGAKPAAGDSDVRPTGVGSSMPCPDWLEWEAAEPQGVPFGSAAARKGRLLGLGYGTRVSVLSLTEVGGRAGSSELRPVASVSLPGASPPAPLASLGPPSLVCWLSPGLLAVVSARSIVLVVPPLPPWEWSSPPPASLSSLTHPLSSAARASVLVVARDAAASDAASLLLASPPEAAACGLDATAGPAWGGNGGAGETAGVAWTDGGGLIAWSRRPARAISLSPADQAARGARAATLEALVFMRRGDAGAAADALSALARTDAAAAIGAAALAGRVFPAPDPGAALAPAAARSLVARTAGSAMLVQSLRLRPDLDGDSGPALVTALIGAVTA